MEHGSTRKARTPRSSTRPIVLLLSGWSDGPLQPLQLQFPSVKFIKVNIPTPPAGARWLWNPYLLAITLILYATPSLMRCVASNISSTSIQYVLQLLLLLSLLSLLRVVVARVVRYAVADSTKTTLRAIEKYKPVAIVGFSWGGGVLYEMLDQWKGPTILLAPTVSAINWVAMKECAHYTFDIEKKRVAVVAGENDPFCPAGQKLLLTKTSCEYYGVEDDHILSSNISRELTGEILGDFLARSRIDYSSAPHTNAGRGQ